MMVVSTSQGCLKEYLKMCKEQVPRHMICSAYKCLLWLECCSRKKKLNLNQLKHDFIIETKKQVNFLSKKDS